MLAVYVVVGFLVFGIAALLWMLFINSVGGDLNIAFAPWMLFCVVCWGIAWVAKQPFRAIRYLASRSNR